MSAVEVDYIHGAPVQLAGSDRRVEPYATDRRLLYDVVKRTFDIAVSLAALVILLPIWLAIAGAIKLTSNGPVLFRGTVVGRYGRSFTWYKFRTMVVAPDHAHRDWLREFVLADRPYEGGRYKLTPDPRVTAVGAVLRRFSLDEVPQFINVLLGQMSIVGPRPPIEYEFSLYDEFRCRRLAVRPGITGLHQVTGRSLVPFSVMLATDLDYIERRSLALDLAIMARTATVMVTGRGAA